jgi:hypothetical protein
MANSKFLLAAAVLVVSAVSAFPQGSQLGVEIAPKIIARSRGNLNDRANLNAHPAATVNVPGGVDGGLLGNGIGYHGGPLLLGTPNVYYIWYGNWNQAGTDNNAAGQSILTDLANNIGGSPYYNILTTYYQGSASTSATGLAHYAGSTSVAYPYGTSLTDAQIGQVVFDAINGNKLPYDTNALYFVLTSSDVTASSGFCSQYCGWHTNGTLRSSGDIKFSFVGNGAACPSSCEAQTTGPNGNAGADGMASVIGHELEETISDPLANAWYDITGQENADKCAWMFGTEFTASNGSKYNMTLGSRNYLIQQNWVDANGGSCALRWP